MFIKDGKSLFNNTGLIISIGILLILLLISYNKCMSSVELFNLPTTIPNTTSGNIKNSPEPKDVRINIKGNTVSINFTVDSNTQIPKKFVIVLAQYDSSLKNTGNNKFYLSNEYEINNAVTANESTYQTNVCTVVNGIPTCSYSFSNLDTIDTNGNLYYYKIGIAAVYDDRGNSNFVTPYNVNSSNKLFSLDSAIDQQDDLFNEFIKYKNQKQLNAQSTGQTSTSNNIAMSTADGQYEIIRAQLGNYPSNLLMDPTSAKQNLLSDLVDKSMAQGLLNVNVSIDNPIS
jgi:hypothetical protein